MAKPPEVDANSLGNVVARMFGVSLARVWELVAEQQPGKQLGQYLLEENLITREQLQRALAYQEAKRAKAKDLSKLHAKAALELTQAIKGKA